MNSEWSREETFRLIDLLKEMPIIWSNANVMHWNALDKKAKRDDAYEEIAAIINKTAYDVKSKIHNLKGQYFRELRKLRLKGFTDSPCNAYVKWFAFHKLTFLSDYPDEVFLSDHNKFQIENIRLEPMPDLDESSGDEINPSVVMEVQEKEIAPIEPRKRSHANSALLSEESSCDNKDQLNCDQGPSRKISKTNDCTSDDFHIFGLHISNELRKLQKNKLVLAIAKKKIYEALSEAELSLLDYCSQPRNNCGDQTPRNCVDSSSMTNIKVEY